MMPMADRVVLIAIAGIAIATAVTKLSGYWLVQRMELSSRVESGMSVLPGAILISLIAPRLMDAGVAEWSSAAVVLVIAVRTGNVLLAILGGVGTVLFMRAFV